MSANRGPRFPVSRPASHPPGRWLPDGLDADATPDAVRTALADVNRSVVVVESPSGPAITNGGAVSWSETDRGYRVRAILPPVRPAALGDPQFCSDHGLHFPYVTGAMANGIASADLVEEISRAGMLAFFGSAGLSLDQIEAAIIRLKASLAERPFGFNLIHSPNEQM